MNKLTELKTELITAIAKINTLEIFRSYKSDLAIGIYQPIELNKISELALSLKKIMELSGEIAGFELASLEVTEKK